MTRLMTAFVSFSLLALCLACGPVRPDTNIYRISAGASAKARGYNMKTDYDSEGNRLPGAQPKEVPLPSLRSLHGWACTDQQGFENLQVFLQDNRDWAKEHCR